LHVSDQLESPVTAGWWQPIVILPSALLTGMSPDLLEALIAHEVGHIQRFDYAVNLAQSTIENLLFSTLLSGGSQNKFAMSVNSLQTK